ncbi:unnamed protein product [Acanthoscelides obtectus]|uniref:Carboxylesterase type B domain-containing protein n=1 Tax=Acanthoscelides obtectus TaxID=200917 RepID=A0A9P0JZS3_ACAOB|nr:unnamed protein product [Acanthoscelides obtectus]CAK1663369.1 hypothetical protein AOBTE_LOCUS23637 [Acanthoscelides obtectus]
MLTAVTGAIMISGSCLSPFGFGLDSKARSNAFMVGRELGLDLDESSENSSTILLEKIQSIPADKFIRIARAPFTPHKGDDGNGIKFAPVFSKDFYPTAPMTDAVDEGNFHKVPLLFGINSEECLTPQYLGFLTQIQRKAIVWDNDISKMIDLNVNIPDRLEAAADMKAIYTNRKFFSDVAAIVKKLKGCLRY